MTAELGLAPEHWYCVSRVGVAMLCSSMEDAQGEAAVQQRDYPRSGPYRAMMLGDVAAERLRWTDAAAMAERLDYDRLAQLQADRKQALRWRDELVRLGGKP